MYQAALEILDIGWMGQEGNRFQGKAADRDAHYPTVS